MSEPQEKQLSEEEKKQLEEARSQWLSELLSENPQLLALRERVLPWTGGYSFANLVHTDTTAVLSHINRHTVLELVYQHLMAIGMHRTAEKVKEESCHEFQRKKDEPWDKTDLLLLVSLGVLPREDPWSIPADPHHKFVEEHLEEDFVANRHREEVDAKKLCEQLIKRDEVRWAKDTPEKSFNTMVAASLRYIVVFLATGSATKDDEMNSAVSDQDQERFFLILHSITRSYHFLEHVTELFWLTVKDPEEGMLQMSEEERQQLRRNIINMMKKWVSFHGLFIGGRTIKAIGQFLRKVIDYPQFGPEKLSKFAQPILAWIPNLTYGKKSGKCDEPKCEPEIPDPQIIFRPSLRIIDPKPVEVARQITLMFHKAFSAVHSREFMVALRSQRASHETPTLTEFFEFSDHLEQLCFETIQSASDREDAAEKIMEIGKELGSESLANFAALASVVRALERPEIEALYREDEKKREKWNLYVTTLSQLRETCGSDPAKMAKYNDLVNRRRSGYQPTVPNLRAELNVQRKKGEEEPDYIDGLIAWTWRWQISEKTVMLYQFQNSPYIDQFWPIPQIQKVISRGPRLA